MLSFFKNLFGYNQPKKIKYLDQPKIGDILTDYQQTKGDAWYNNHRDHVKRLVSMSGKAYPPSLLEDKNNPALWKPEHWRWYLNERS